MTKLKQMVSHVYNNSPFYMELLQNHPEINLVDFHILPVVRKDDFYKSRCPLISMDGIIGYSKYGEEIRIFMFTDGAKISDTRIDILILDVDISGMNGIEVKQRFQKNESETLIIFVTK